MQDLIGGGAEKQEGLMMSASKESRFRGGANHYILIKDYEDKCLFKCFRITRTTRQGLRIKKNLFYFFKPKNSRLPIDFLLNLGITIQGHYLC